MRDDQEIRLGCLQIAMGQTKTAPEAIALAQQLVPFVTGKPSTPVAEQLPPSPPVKAVAPKRALG